MAAGESLFLGIAVDLDASGVVRGVNLAEQQIHQLGTTGQRAGDQVQRRTRELQQGLGAVGGVVTGVGLASTLAGETLRRNLLNPMLDAASSFEVQFNQLRFVTGATGEELEAIRDFVLQIGVETQFSPDEATEGLRTLRAAGLDTETAMTSLRASLDLATGSGGTIDLVQAATATAAALNQFGDGAINARSTMNQFSQATRETNFQPRDFPVFLRSLGDMPRRFNLATSEAFALGGALRNLGILPAQAGNAIQGMGNRLLIVQRQVDRFLASGGDLASESAPQMVRAFQRFGIQLFDSEGQLRGMTDVMSELADAAGSFTNDQEFLTTAQTLLGQSASKVVTGLANMERGSLTGSDAFRDLVAVLEATGDPMDDTVGTAREMAQAFEETGEGMRTFLGGSIETIFIALGRELEPVIKSVTSVLIEMANAFLGLINEFPILRKAIAFIIVGLTIFATVAGVALLAIGSMLLLGAGLAPMFTGAAGASTVFTGALAVMETVLLPILSAMLSFFALVGVAVLAGIAVWHAYENNLGGFKDFIDEWVADMRTLWAGLSDFFNSPDGSISQATEESLNERGLLDTFLFIAQAVRRLEEIWEGMKDTFEATGQAISFVLDLLFEAVGFVIEIFGELAEAVGFEFDDDIESWRLFGHVLGVVVVIAVAALIVKMVLLSLAALGAAVSMFLALLPIILIAAAIGLLIFAIVKLVGWFMDIVDAAAEFAKDFLRPFVHIGAKLFIFWDRLTAADAPWRRHWATFKSIFIDPPWNAMRDLFVGIGEFFSGIWEEITATFQAAGEQLSGVFDPLMDAFDELSEFVDGFFDMLWDDIVQSFENMFAPASGLGSGLMDAFSGGIDSSWDDFINSFSENIVEVRDLLPGSDAKTGPLSDLTASGRGLLTTLQEGAESAAPGMMAGLSGILGGVAQTLAGGEGGGGPLQALTQVLTGTGGEEAAVDAAGSGGGPISITIEGITIQVQEASPEEAERLVDMIMDKMRERLENDQEATFA